MIFKRLGNGIHHVEVADLKFRVQRCYDVVLKGQNAFVQVFWKDQWRAVEEVWPERPLPRGGSVGNVRIRDVRAWLVHLRDDIEAGRLQVTSC